MGSRGRKSMTRLDGVKDKPSRKIQPKRGKGFEVELRLEKGGGSWTSMMRSGPEGGLKGGRLRCRRQNGPERIQGGRNKGRTVNRKGLKKKITSFVL